jgi:hypothetical protein
MKENLEQKVKRKARCIIGPILGAAYAIGMPLLGTYLDVYSNFLGRNANLTPPQDLVYNLSMPSIYTALILSGRVFSPLVSAIPFTHSLKPVVDILSVTALCGSWLGLWAGAGWVIEKGMRGLINSGRINTEYHNDIKDSK